jgi:probable metal-binding protein
MNKHIHGHEVMKMMLGSGRVFTRESLRSAIQKNFGIDTRFFTCSAENMTADELIDFLNTRGKFLLEDGGFITDKTMICDDD